MKIIDAKNRRAVEALFKRDSGADASFDKRVRDIVNGVRRGGDRALARYAARFDNATEPLEVSKAEMRDYAALVASDVRRAIRTAAGNIARVAARQIPQHWDLSFVPGVTIEQRVEPLARVGCYVPGGRFPLPSSLLMTAVPARVAGVREVIVMCPRPEPAVMAAALEAGVTRMFRIGGAHAIAALAYGTARVPRVDKIVGPGNRFVAAAKACVASDCAIDFYAGPTEIVIVAGGGRPDWIAADLIAQAEHDPDARSIFVTWSRALAGRVSKATDGLAAGSEIVKRSLAAHGAIVVTLDETRQAMKLMAEKARVISEGAGVKQYVQLLGRGLVGVEASNGRFLWV